jgi:hypothetical protein
VKTLSGRNLQRLFQLETIPHPRRAIQARNSTLKTNLTFQVRNYSPIIYNKKIKTNSHYPSEVLKLLETRNNSTVAIDFKDMTIGAQICIYQITRLVELINKCKT